MAISTPSRRPRMNRATSTIAYQADSGALTTSVSAPQEPAFPLVALLLPARGNVKAWVIVPLILMAIGLFRWATGFWGFSGKGKPPMYGDFEAQRHWMELTTNLPVSHWYFYDLQWWGLDYPPLTAYHSWLLGRIGSYIDPTWFSLYTSRGLDNDSLKLYMRTTVIVSEFAIFIPAAVICVRRLARVSGMGVWESSIALIALLMQPGNILIDHGHFQYNTVMLGFVLAMLASMFKARPVRSCIYFVAALGFKQMALFYAPAVFAYLLGVCVFPKMHVSRFLQIAAVTAMSFVALFLPFIVGIFFNDRHSVPLASDHQPPALLKALPLTLSEKSVFYPYVLQLTQCVHRVFPFARGVFEDKVANVWCAIHSSGLHKLHQYDSSLLSRAALALTSLAIIPPCFIIFIKPRRMLIPWALSGCAWGFFLCSYQVHEKNVLLPLLPMTLLLATEKGLKPDIRAWVGLANILGCWTMYPLLQRDELRVPYTILTLLWAWMLGLPPTSLAMYFGKQRNGLNSLTKAVHLVLYASMIAWHAGEALVKPPSHVPDLWVVLNAIIGAGGFGICYLWCLWNLASRAGLYGVNTMHATPTKKTQ